PSASERACWELRRRLRSEGRPDREQARPLEETHQRTRTEFVAESSKAHGHRYARRSSGRDRRLEFVRRFPYDCTSTPGQHAPARTVSSRSPVHGFEPPRDRIEGGPDDRG